MTYFSDLSPYTFLPESIPPDVAAVNVGWLDSRHAFDTGAVPDEFTEKLGRLCRDSPHARTRGHHGCELPHADEPAPWPVTADIDGESVPLGSAEVRVVSRTGTWLVAPNLVHHYVVRHAYRPPAEFVEAVVALRVADSG
ncbi:hypothetical protein E1265_08510 [Streptomyces sp. 8K308]|uniref:DUF7919 family protein n=1 Tax=Streptomyces sp. 8K308 TaxID=2530388 RepID=UPI00104453A6|nr:hypothetical protein [Streptomyces sp. 8K308]TDC24828.1 hypothetical protein E1265_08510 [Streptomyces sp. 8K308]